MRLLTDSAPAGMTVRDGDVAVDENFDDGDDYFDDVAVVDDVRTSTSTTLTFPDVVDVVDDGDDDVGDVAVDDVDGMSTPTTSLTSPTGANVGDADDGDNVDHGAVGDGTPQRRRRRGQR